MSDDIEDAIVRARADRARADRLSDLAAIRALLHAVEQDHIHAAAMLHGRAAAALERLVKNCGNCDKEPEQ